MPEIPLINGFVLLFPDDVPTVSLDDWGRILQCLARADFLGLTEAQARLVNEGLEHLALFPSLLES